MKIKSTAGIIVSVESLYQVNDSNPLESHYFFAYRITIVNASDYKVQLKKRHWYVFDSNGIKSEVIGEGVVGVQPILAPGELYRYVSGCNLTTDMGKMRGIFQMERLNTGEKFNVTIPEFLMIAPFKLN